MLVKFLVSCLFVHIERTKVRKKIQMCKKIDDFSKKMQKCLVNPKKSSTFARFFACKLLIRPRDGA